MWHPLAGKSCRCPVASCSWPHPACLCHLLSRPAPATCCRPAAPLTPFPKPEHHSTPTPPPTRTYTLAALRQSTLTPILSTHTLTNPAAKECVELQRAAARRSWCLMYTPSRAISPAPAAPRQARAALGWAALGCSRLLSSALGCSWLGLLGLVSWHVCACWHAFVEEAQGSRLGQAALADQAAHPLSRRIAGR